MTKTYAPAVAEQAPLTRVRKRGYIEGRSVWLELVDGQWKPSK